MVLSGPLQKNYIEKRKHELFLDDNMAREMFVVESRKALMYYISDSRRKKSRVDSVKVIKNMVLFYNAVISPLLKTFRNNKYDPPEHSTPEVRVDKEHLLTNSNTEKMDSTEKSQAQDIDTANYRTSNQKDLTLSEDLSFEDRCNIYKSYLQFSLTGDVVKLGLGSTLTLERDEEEFIRLGQLCNILGLETSDITSIHRDMAELAFKKQVMQIAGDGDITENRMKQIIEMQKNSNCRI